MRKGNISLQKVGAIVLVIATVAILIAGFNVWFDDIVNDFVGTVEYPG